MSDRPTITIPAPKFEQYQMVTLHWNDQAHFTKVTRRWFDLDCGDNGCWYYETTVNQPKLYPEGVLEASE